MSTTMRLSKRNYSFSFAYGLLVILLVIGVGKAQLSPNFYSSSCPQVYQIIGTAVARAVRAEPRMGASLLRLHYNDCFVNGCDASVLLDDTPTFTGEKSAAQNVNSLRGFDVIDTIKSLLEMNCPGVVSCADILAVAARDSVVALKGPRWPVAVGRRDSKSASLTAANNEIPGPDLNLDALITAFSNKGFNAREMVALSGAHTIGQARCTMFRNRIYNETNINPTFATSIRGNCPRTRGRGDDNLSPLDSMSPKVFNNDYFTDLVNLRGLLHSDQQLLSTGGSVANQVRAYSTNSASFFNDFAAAMLKMSNLSPLTGFNGEVRRNCRRRNSFSFS